MLEELVSNLTKECTQNKVVMLFPMKKRGINSKKRAIGSSQVRRGTHQRTINKLENTLSKQIRLHLHSLINIIGVRDL
jgi:hypothetical protein